MKSKLYLSFLLLIVMLSFSFGQGYVKKIGTQYQLHGNYIVPAGTDQYLMGSKNGDPFFYSNLNINSPSFFGNTYDLGSGPNDPEKIIKSEYTNCYYSIASDGYVFLIMKLDNMGKVLYCKSYPIPGSGSNEHYDLIELPNADIIALTDLTIMRMDSAGNFIWKKRLPEDGYYTGLTELNGFNFLVSGSYRNSLTWNSGTDQQLMCVDTAANILWSRAFGTQEYEFGECVTSSTDGKIFIGGYCHQVNTNLFSGQVSCLDTLGNLLWNRQYEYLNDFQILHMVMLPDAKIMMHGISASNNIFSIIDTSGDVLRSELLLETMQLQSGIQLTEDTCIVFTAAASNAELLIKMNHFNLPSCLNTSYVYVHSQSVPFLAQDFPHPSLANISNVLAYTGPADTLTVGLYNQCAVSCGVTSGFHSGTSNVCVNTTVSFINTSQHATQYAWKINNLPFSALANPSHVFSVPGDYLVQLIASNGACRDTSSVVIHVQSLPAAGFEVNQNYLQAFCNADSSGNNYLWNFGDGTITDGKQLSNHEYEQAGNYSICMTEKNVCGVKTTCHTAYIGATHSNSFRKLYHFPSSWALFGFDILPMKDGSYYCFSGSDYNNYGSIIQLDNTGKTINNTAMFSTVTGTVTLKRPYYAGNGNIYFVSYAEDFGVYTLQLARTDTMGQRWRTQFGVGNVQDQIAGIVELKNKSFIIGASRGQKGLFIMFDQFGNLTWKKSFTGIKQVSGIAETADSCILVLATEALQGHITLFKIDRNGNTIWSHGYEGMSVSSTPACLILLKNGNYLVSGGNGTKGFMMQTDTAGNVLWSRLYYRNSNTDVVKNVAEAFDGSLYFVFGYFSGGAKSNYLAHTDDVGNLLEVWKGDAHYNAIKKTIDSSLVVIGNRPFPFMNDPVAMEVIKFGTGGPPGCAFTIDSIHTIDTLFTINSFFAVADSLPPAITFGNPFIANAMSHKDSVICFADSLFTLAAFTNSTGCPGGPVQFTNTSTGPVASCLWTFQGAVNPSSTLFNPTATWTNPGTYSVTLLVTDSFGNQASWMHQVIIAGLPSPQVTTIGSLALCNGSSVTLSVPNIIGNTYQWYNYNKPVFNATANSITVYRSGLYYAAVTNQSNCISKSHAVSVYHLCPPYTPGGGPVKKFESAATESLEFELHPNPVQEGNVQISYNLPGIDDGLFEIYSSLGSLIFSLPLENETHSQEISLPGMENGVYLTMIRTNSGSILRRLVVMK